MTESSSQSAQEQVSSSNAEPGGSVPASPTALTLLATVIPALIVGAVSALILVVVTYIANWLQQILWTALPGAMGVADTTTWWTFLILALTGIAVGMVVWKMPGHAGPDPATTSLVERPLALPVLPSLLIALILMLAGGVSLGPENPIMAVNTGLIVALGTRFIPRMRAPVWVGLSSAGMIAAMFGTPVAAALVLSESTSGDPRTPLWDRLFAPLVAAGAGAITMTLLGGASFALSVAPYDGVQAPDLLSGGVIAAVSALIGLVAVYAFLNSHRILHRLANPLVMITVGGILLGILGIIGGPITLFKGLEEMKELVDSSAQYTFGGLVLVTLVKLVAMIVASTSGFRGGRIFPCVFVGVGIGLAANALVPSIPQAIAVSCGVLGILMAVTRQGWLSLFMAAIVVPDTTILPILCLASLPAWLIVTGRPEMRVIEMKSSESAHSIPAPA